MPTQTRRRKMRRRFTVGQSGGRTERPGGAAAAAAEAAAADATAVESDDGACRHGTCDTEWAFFSDGTAGPQWVQRMEREEHGIVCTKCEVVRQ